MAPLDRSRVKLLSVALEEARRLEKELDRAHFDEDGARAAALSAVLRDGRTGADEVPAQSIS
jgi:hypothetical protein